MLNGLYRSNNSNLHEFRQPSGLVSTVSEYVGMNMKGPRQRESKLFRGKSSNILCTSTVNIVKPLDFSTLRGHTLDKDRAIESQQKYHQDYAVNFGSNYRALGPPGSFLNSRKKSLVKEVGSGFRTELKAHDEGSRIKLIKDNNPVTNERTISVDSLSSTRLEEIEARKSLARNFRKEATKRSSWMQF